MVKKNSVFRTITREIFRPIPVSRADRFGRYVISFQRVVGVARLTRDLHDSCVVGVCCVDVGVVDVQRRAHDNGCNMQ
jgi:hypothetical protein